MDGEFSRFIIGFTVALDKGNRLVTEKKGKAKIRSTHKNLDSYYPDVRDFLKAQLLSKGLNVLSLDVNSITNG